MSVEQKNISSKGDSGICTDQGDIPNRESDTDTSDERKDVTYEGARWNYFDQDDVLSSGCIIGIFLYEGNREIPAEQKNVFFKDDTESWGF